MVVGLLDHWELRLPCSLTTIHLSAMQMMKITLPSTKKPLGIRGMALKVKTNAGLQH